MYWARSVCSRFDIYWIQTDKQTDKQSIYINLGKSIYTYTVFIDDFCPEFCVYCLVSRIFCLSVVVYSLVSIVWWLVFDLLLLSVYSLVSSVWCLMFDLLLFGVYSLVSNV